MCQCARAPRPIRAHYKCIISRIQGFQVSTCQCHAMMAAIPPFQQTFAFCIYSIPYSVANQCLTCPLSPRTSSSAPPATSARPSRADRIEVVQRLSFQSTSLPVAIGFTRRRRQQPCQSRRWQKGSHAIPPA